MKKKILGYNFLHTHPFLEKQLGLSLPPDHVIVDRNDLEEVILFLNDRPDLVKLIGRSDVSHV